MNSSRLTHPIWLVLAGFVLASSLKTSSLQTSETKPIVFVGVFTPQSDPTFQKLSASFAARHPSLLGSHPLIYAHYAGDHFDDAVESIRQALKSVDARPAALVAPTATTARFVARMNGSTPLVFASHQHPVYSHIVDSMGPRRPHITGVSLADSLHAKRLELLREAFPGVRSIAVLADRWWAESDENAKIVVEAGLAMGIQVTLVLAETAGELDAAMTSPSASRFDAWYVPATYISYLQQTEVIANIRRSGKPSIHAKTLEVQSGALMAYAQDTSFAIDAMADLLARICNGERAGDIPIERPRRFVLSLRAQYDLGGARIAPAVVARADRVE